MNPRGAALHELVVHHVQIGRQWMDRGHYSFSWWPGFLAQRVTSYTEIKYKEGFLVPLVANTRIAVRTREGETRASLVMNELNIRSTGTSAMVWVPETGSVVLSTRQIVTMPQPTSELGWFASRAILQARDAHDLADEVVGLLGGTRADSAPPGLKPRRTKDRVLGILERVFVPSCNTWDPSFWQAETKNTARFLEESGFSVSSTPRSLDARTTTVMGEVTLRFEAVSSSKAGSGTRVTLELPVRGEKEQMAVMANRRNLYEAGHMDSFSIAGAWRALPHDNVDSSLGFVSFLPSVLHVPGYHCFSVLTQLERLASVLRFFEGNGEPGLEE